MSVRLFWRYVGAPMNREGGPWWYCDCETEEEALRHPNVFMRDIAEAKLAKEDHRQLDYALVYPPDDAFRVWDGKQRVYEEEKDD